MRMRLFTCLTLLVHCWLLGHHQALADDASSRPPNIVFILADDLGYRELGCYGQTKIQTPNLDRLARQGMRFTQHYSGNAVCAPSRCVLMTGKHPGHAAIRDNRETKPEGQWPLPAEELTLFEHLKSAGYVTGAFGKWGLGGPGSVGEPLKQGVDRFYGYNCQAHAHSYYPAYLWDNDQRVPLNNHPPIPGHAKFPAEADPTDPRSFDRFKGTDYAPDRIHQQALAFIAENRERPFFLYYPSIMPHVALQVPDNHLKPYLDQNWVDPPFVEANGLGYTPHFTPRAAYAAMISALDKQVGEVVQAIDDAGLAEHTLIVFTSDNGTTHLKDEVDYEFFQSVGELRGLKGSLYEGGIRVPALVRWPGKVPAGQVTSFVSGFEDWMPTLAQCAGIPTPENIDGISLTPTLLGHSQPTRPYLYREFPGYGGQQSIRVGKWKAIHQAMHRGKRKLELYDLENDPSEAHNVAQQFPEKVAELSQLMSQVRVESAVFPLTGKPDRN